MNNSYFLYADNSKTQKDVIGNLRFFLKELMAYDHTFFRQLFLYPIPQQISNLLMTWIPALLVSLLEKEVSLRQLLLYMTGVGLLWLIVYVLQFMLEIQNYIRRKFISFHLTKLFLNKMKEIDYELIEKKGFAETYSNAWNSAKNGQGFYEGAMLIPYIINTLLGIIVYGFLLGKESLLLLGLVLVSVGLNVYLLQVARKVHRKYYTKIGEAAKSVAYISEITMDSAAGKDIRIYNMLDFILKKYDEKLAVMGNGYQKVHHVYMLRGGADAVFSFARDIVSYTMLINFLVSGKISVAEFVFLLGVITSLADYFEKFLREVLVWNTLDASAGFFRSFLGTKSSFTKESRFSEKEIQEMKSHGLMLELRNVSYTYESASKPVIDKLNLTIHAGEKLALIGLNGAGKTTLVKLISGLYRPDEGQIFINGVDSALFTKEEYTSLISVMFQDHYFLPFTLDKNITGAEVTEEKKLEKVLKYSGFYERYQSLPHQGDTKLVKKLESEAVDFSGGEKQKLLFARCLYKEAPLVILDEPTAALDPIAESQLYENFREAIGDMTAIYISHRLSSTRFCDRIVLIENGTVLEEGTHEGLLDKNGRYAQLFQMQSKYYQEEQEHQRRLQIMED